MKYLITFGIMVATALTYFLGVYQGKSEMITPKINVVECPSLAPTIAKSYVEIEGSDCTERQGGYRDLLQPTGLWGMRVFECWKLEQTIENYCAENPLHCGDKVGT